MFFLLPLMYCSIVNELKSVYTHITDFMEPAQFEILFKLYLKGKGSKEQIRELFDYINNSENEQIVLGMIDQFLRKQQQEELISFQKEELILREIFYKGQPVEQQQRRKYRWIKIAAAILVIFSVSFIILNRSAPISNQRMISKEKAVDDIMPGGNKAILTLGDGSEIILDNVKQGEIGQEGDARIVKLGDGQISYSKTGDNRHTVLYNVMTTPRGGQYKLILPDGTIAWLNAASSIKYPTSFVGKTREVLTTGEVYFEVAHDVEKPFYVRSESQLIKVLGTHFNINAYTNEACIKTTLLEGSVKIFSASSSEVGGLTIKPDEQASFANGIFTKTTVNAENAISWKNGLTSFENADIRTIMRQIERWYDIDAVYSKHYTSDRLFSGEIPRTATLSEVFKILELNDIHFKIQGKTVVVSP